LGYLEQDAVVTRPRDRAFQSDKGKDGRPESSRVQTGTHDYFVPYSSCPQSSLIPGSTISALSYSLAARTSFGKSKPSRQRWRLLVLALSQCLQILGFVFRSHPPASRLSRSL